MELARLDLTVGDVGTLLVSVTSVWSSCHIMIIKIACDLQIRLELHYTVSKLTRG
jgi:hypothetical protein